MNIGKPHHDDIAAGQRIREIRERRGISQETLAHKLGISFQQVQKYEKGHNRIGVSRLIAIATALQVDIAQLIPSATPVIRGIAPFSPKIMEICRRLEKLQPVQIDAMARIIGELAKIQSESNSRCNKTIDMFEEDAA